MQCAILHKNSAYSHIVYIALLNYWKGFQRRENILGMKILKEYSIKCKVICL